LVAPFLLAKAFGGLMVAAGSGSVVNVASVAGLQGVADRSAYNASKHGLIGLTRTLAVEWGARGVRVNAVCPGWVKTEMDHKDQAGGSYSDRGSYNQGGRGGYNDGGRGGGRGGGHWREQAPGGVIAQRAAAAYVLSTAGDEVALDALDAGDVTPAEVLAAHGVSVRAARTPTVPSSARTSWPRYTRKGSAMAERTRCLAPG
jgi:NAD(P)-dependent dehydrogenase (short-subunit alcohol dehydrogenase family)